MDIIKAVVPRVRKTKNDLSMQIAMQQPVFISYIANITGMFENPGFTPNGSGIRLSAPTVRQKEQEAYLKELFYMIFSCLSVLDFYYKFFGQTYDFFTL